MTFRRLCGLQQKTRTREELVPLLLFLERNNFIVFNTKRTSMTMILTLNEVKPFFDRLRKQKSKKTATSSKKLTSAIKRKANSSTRRSKKPKKRATLKQKAEKN